MIGTIRKHSSWLWVVIITVTIFTFVYWGSQSSRFDERRAGNYGSIDGRRISRDEFAAAQSEVYLRYFFNHGSWPDTDTRKSGFDPEREIYQWLFFVRKLQQFDIRVDSRSVAQAVNEILRSFGRDNPVPFNVFVQQVLMPHGISTEDFERFVRHDLGVQQLASVVALSGKLVTPEEAQYLYQRDHQEYSCAAVFFSASNYLARVTNVTAAAVAQFYTNEMAAYHIPERMQVSYVAFDISNYLGVAEQQFTNLTESVEQAFRQLDTNYTRFGKTPDEAKARIREELIRRRGAAEAEKQANDLAAELFNMEPEQAGNLAVLAKTNGLALRITQPFDEENGPSEFDGGPNFAKAAFLLSAEKPFPEQAIVGEKAVYLIAFEKRLPDEILPLDQIQDRVAADYRYRHAVLLVRSAGEDFVSAATNALAHGKTFAAVCADAGFKPVTVPLFSISTRELPEVEDRVNLSFFKQVTVNTPPQTLSRFAQTREGGFVVYVRERLPVEPARMAAGMPTFLNLLRRARQQEALNLWLMREGSVSLRNTPLAQRKQPPAGAEGQGEP